MGRQDRERREGIREGSILPFPQARLIQRLRTTIRDAQETFGHDLVNRMLLFAMERPEAGK